MRSPSSSSLVESKVRAKRFSKSSEWGMPIGFKFFMARTTSRWLNGGVALNNDVADFEFRTFVDGEVDIDAARRHLAELRSNGGVLVAALCFIFLQYVLGALHFAGIVLRFGRQIDVTLFEAIENFGFTDGLVAGVVDGMDGAAFGDNET